MDFQHLIESTSKVIAGDAQEEERLGVLPIEVDFPQIKFSETEIAVSQHCLSEVAAAAGALGLNIVEGCAKTGLGVLDAVSKVSYKKLLEPLNVDPSEYAQSMQAMLLQLKNWAVKMEHQLADETSVTKSVAQEEELEDHLPLVEGPDDIVIGSDEEMRSKEVGVISPMDYGGVVGARTGGTVLKCRQRRLVVALALW